jgi:hypothetical protein
MNQSSFQRDAELGRTLEALSAALMAIHVSTLSLKAFQGLPPIC